MEQVELKFNEMGLIPAIVQDSDTKEVLMMAYMNKESLMLTIRTKRLHIGVGAEKTMG